jgi:hypothetical protein
MNTIICNNLKKNNIAIGILIYTTPNLGDWTQTVAALYVWWTYFKKPNTFKVFLNNCITTSQINDHPIVWLDRDYISLIPKPDNIEKVIMICNAWWMHKIYNVFNFPPPNWIIPIYISMHFQNPKILTPNTITHLQSFQPIGCRDISTKNLLEKHNIKAYFSGCLTMLLNLHDIKLGFTQTYDYSNINVHIDCYQKKCSFNNEICIKKTQHHSNIYDIYNILHVIQELFNFLYAKKIVTTRLHIWLPLICNNSNVVLLNKKTSKIFKNNDTDNQGQKINRFRGLTETVSDKNNLQTFKNELLNETLNKISFILNKVTIIQKKKFTLKK